MTTFVSENYWCCEWYYSGERTKRYAALILFYGCNHPSKSTNMIFWFKFRNLSTIFATLDFLLTPHMGPIWVLIWFWRGCTWFSHDSYSVQSWKYNLYWYQMHKMYQGGTAYMNWIAGNILNMSVDSSNVILWFVQVPHGTHMGRTQKV